jgi:hypothetical protein
MRQAVSVRSAEAAQPGWVLRVPALMISRRAVGLIAFAGLAAALVAYMVVNVPLDAPRLPRAEVTRYWGAAAIAAAVVAIGAAAVVVETLRAMRAAPPEAVAHSAPATDRPLVPRSLTFESVPGRLLAIAVAISMAGVAVAFLVHARLWVGGLAFALPWIPFVALEAKWKYARYGVFAVFLLLVLMQVMHMGEHAMQVGQLYVHRGDLAQSHGVFGQLDFELVHFVTDTMLWVSLGLLVIVFRGRNPWLWVAFAAASLHQIEHFYLFWMYQTHGAFYAQGGFAGIMGENGLIGSPLDRPYLHFTYNLIVVVPMVIALWDQARRVDEQAEARL